MTFLKINSVIANGSVPYTSIMPSSGFKFIEQYRTLAKEFEQTCQDVLDLEHESIYLLEDADFKPEIKLEAEDGQPDIFSMMESISNNNSSNTSDDTVNSSKNCSNILSNSRPKNVFTSNTGGQNRITPISTIPPVSSSSAVTTTAALSLFTSSPSPTMSSSSLPILSPFSTSTSMRPNFTSTETSTFVTKLGGSGCTLVSTTDFLLDTTSTMSQLDIQEDGLEYTDLDKPLMSLYNDYEHFSNMSKTGGVSDESNSVPLEAVFMMTDTIQSDCDNLSVPYDPLNWTTEHVKRWVSWVCQRNRVQDVSPSFYQFDGPAMCSLTHDELSSLGEAGVKISNELELLKAANSCFPNQNIDDMSSPNHPCIPYMENLQAVSFTSCVSPAPSTCSSSHDSNTSTLSTHSDPSDDESGYGSQISTSSKFGEVNGRISAKAPTTGRGHKQTIHLWQFLRELLLSKDSNYSDCIRWLDRKAGVFKIEDSKRVASLWGARKNRPAMNYDKLSRSVRQYYKKGIIKKTEQSKRLVYQFCAGYM